MNLLTVTNRQFLNASQGVILSYPNFTGIESYQDPPSSDRITQSTLSHFTIVRPTVTLLCELFGIYPFPPKHYLSEI